MTVKLGKLPRSPKWDHAIKLASIAKKILPPMPDSFNVDKSFPKLTFPVGNDYGNNNHGCCVMVSQFMYQMRAEAKEQNRVLPITTEDVLRQYWHQLGVEDESEEVREQHDRGLVMLESLLAWKKKGILIGEPKKFLWFTYNGNKYRNYAFAKIDIPHLDELKAAIYFLSGMPTGFLLPITAAEQWEKGENWEYIDKPGKEPNSWGGHAIYILAYEKIGNKYYFIGYTWGKLVVISYDFMLHYSDEAYAVVDRKDSKGSPLDYSVLNRILREVSK